MSVPRRTKDNYPIARGYAPPPGYVAPVSRTWKLAWVMVGLFVFMFIGWFIFQRPGGDWLRRLNYQGLARGESPVVVAEAAVEFSKEEKRRDVPKVAAVAPLVEQALEKASAKREVVSFNQVNALFQIKCINCHSAPKKKGGLDLRTIAAIMNGGDSGPAVVAGKPDDSTLWDSIDTDRMPPDKNKKLTSAEKELVRRWIKSGAK